MNDKQNHKKSDAMGPEKIFSQAMTIIIPMLEFGRALIPGNIPLDRKPGISMTKMLGKVMGLLLT